MGPHLSLNPTSSRSLCLYNDVRKSMTESRLPKKGRAWDRASVIVFCSPISAIVYDFLQLASLRMLFNGDF